jgi:tRNA threonylcarbamoyladenosine biosynthesis protein TsaE
LTEPKEIFSKSSEETLNLGKEFAASLSGNSIVGLFGDLGSGKTQFVKGVCEYFNVKDNISSPTFIIVNEYDGYDDISKSEIKINHFDLYRLKNFKELQEIGFDNYIENNSLCLIEWAELTEDYLRNDLIKVYFSYGKSENERIIKY